jgi:Ca-activated chloride channel family protein
MVIMKRSIIFATLLNSCFIHSNFIVDSLSNYRGNHAFAKKDFKRAQAEYSKILESSPYDPEANYNVGLSLYKQNRFEDAQHYFDRAEQSAGKNNVLLEQALFNEGNAYVQLKKLENALKSYEKVLEVNPKNQQAQQNIDIVKKMMQQPPDQQDQDNGSDDQKDENQKNKDGKQKKNKKDQRSNDQRSNDQQSDDQDSSDQDSDDLDQKEKQKQESSKQKKQQGKNNKGDEQDNQADQQADENDTQENKDQQLEKSKKQTRDGKQTQKEKQQEQSLQKSQEQQDQFNDQDEKGNAAELQDELAEQVEAKPEDDDRLDKRSALVMQKMSEHEDNLQKQILKMNVSKSGAAKYGQKNW